jgi:hypothetical protein
MDETTAVTKQWTDEGSTLVLRVGEREYFRAGLTGDETRRWWYADPSDSKPQDEATSDLLDALVEHAAELSPEEPKPLDVDDVYDDLVEALRANEECQAEELCESELAGQLYGRDDSVAVAAIREALDRPYFDQGTTATLREVYGGTLECC